MIRSFVFKGRRLLKNVSKKQLMKSLKDKKATVWVDVQKATEDDYKFLHQAFGFHPLSIDDCRKAIELPKVDIYENYLFIVLHTPPSEFEKIEFTNREVDFFLGDNFLVSIHKYKSAGVERLIEKFSADKKGAPERPDFIMYHILDSEVDIYFPMLDKWEDSIEKLEEEIIEHKHPRNTLKQIMGIKKELLKLRRSISPQIDVVNHFTKKDFPFIQPKTSLYFKDVHDHLMRIYSELETQRDLLKNAFDAHNSVISKQMTESSTKMNQVMQKLTIIATIFMPLTFITGVYGMNFRNMPELYWRYGYFIILGIMIVVGIIMYAFFRRKKWA